MTRKSQKKIATINDFSGFGRCSISVTLPIVSALKIQCCPIPTSIFSNHTGFPSFFYTDYTEHMNAYMDEWVKLGLRFDGILTGFLGSEKQINPIKRFFKLFKTDETIVVVDPVMGDYGKLYPTYTAKLAQSLKSLISLADILTPNLTEACVLADVDYQPHMDDKSLLRLCQKLSVQGPRRIVITGLERGSNLENFVYVRDEEPQTIGSAQIGPCRSGTGDVFSSIVVGDVVNGVDFSQSVRHAVDFISKTMKITLDMGVPPTDGLCFEELLQDL